MKSPRFKRKKYASLPPHSNEAYPLTNLGEAKKPLVIAIITIGALIVLALLLFFSGQFVGKAITIIEPTEVDTAGIFISGGQRVGETFDVPVQVHIGNKKSVAVSFMATYDQAILDIDCDNIFNDLDALFVVDGKELWVERTSTCAEGSITFNYAGLCRDSPLGETDTCSNAITEIKTIATIKFTALAPATPTTISFDSPSGNFEIIDLDNDDAISLTRIHNGDITIEAPGAETHSCTGDIPVNAELCLGADQDLPADVPRSLKPRCTGAKCEYICVSGYHYDSDTLSCVLDVVPDAASLSFSTTTTITAQTIIPEAVVYTILKKSDGTILVLKSEKIFNLAVDDKYQAAVSYPYAHLVASKEVNVWDKLPDQGRQVHGQLVRSISQPEELVVGTGITLTG